MTDSPVSTLPAPPRMPPEVHDLMLTERDVLADLGAVGPRDLMVQILTLAHRVQQLAERTARAEDRFDRMAQIVTTLALSAPGDRAAVEQLDRDVSQRLNGGAGEWSIEQMRESLSGLLGREEIR